MQKHVKVNNKYAKVCIWIPTDAKKYAIACQNMQLYAKVYKVWLLFMFRNDKVFQSVQIGAKF